jgi:mannitol/fructose-specific phosphotransferase system IIA component (Ntr-type)
MQLFGIAAPLYLITRMGTLSVAFSAGLVTVAAVWYFAYASRHIVREGAIYHLFERLGQRRYEGLDRELRGILKEKGLRREDPFDEVVSRSIVFDVTGTTDFEDLLDTVAPVLAERVGEEPVELREAFLQGTRIGATPVTHGVALPHVRLKSLQHPELVLVRAKEGIDIQLDGEPPFGHHHHTEPRVFALFFLASPEGDPARHLRILAQIAGRVDESSFRQEWESARDEHALKEVLLRDERFLTLTVSTRRATADFVGRALREIEMPEDTLVTVIRRQGDAFVPRGSTVLHEGDRVTIIGTPRRIRELDELYGS